MFRAEIIAIGSELLTPFRVDTNSLFLTRSLEENGIRVIAKTIIGDDESGLAHAFAIAFSRADIILCSGGLGPTIDDITREALAAFLNVSLIPDENVLASIETRFRSRGIRMPEVNKKQAMVPEGGKIMENPVGTAPGILETRGKQVFLMPGPPHELEKMWNERALQLLRKGTPIVRSIFKVAMMGESFVDELLKPVTSKLRQVQYTILAAASDIEIHLTAPADASAEREEAAAGIRKILSPNIYAEEITRLEDVVAKLLSASGKTLAIAESCTGGLTSHRITEIPGSSAYFLGGVVVYSNRAKTSLIAVPEELIREHGAVSEPVAKAMAEGVITRFGSRIGIGITGIAGPDGGSAEKPVGTVFVALAETGMETTVQRYNFPGERSRIKFMASQGALHQLRLRLVATS